MNTANLIAAAREHSTMGEELEQLALHIITSSKCTYESQIGFALAYYKKTESTIAAALITGLAASCPPRLLPAVIERISNMAVLVVAVPRALQNGFKISTETLVEALSVKGEEADELIEEVVSIEFHKAAENGVPPPYAISQSIANDLLLALEENPRLLAENHRFLPLLLSASGLAGQQLTKQIAILHYTVDYTRLIDNLIQSEIPFDHDILYTSYMENVRNVVILAKLAVLNQKTAETANLLLFMLESEEESTIGPYVEAFRILIAFDLSNNEELSEAVIRLGKLIAVFDHFVILIKDIAKNVRYNQQGYNYLHQFVIMIIQFAQKKSDPSNILELLNQTADSFSLHENIEIFGNSLESLSYVANSKSCRVEEFCNVYLSWEKIIETVEAEKTNLLASLSELINCTRRIDIGDFETATYMITASKCMAVLKIMDDSAKLKFLTNLNVNVNERHESNDAYCKFIRNLQDSYLEEIVMSARQQNIDLYLNYIQSLVPSEEVKRPVALLVQKVASLLTLPKELQNVVIQLLSAFITRFPDVLGEKTNAIFDILISQMLKNEFEQSLCFKIICAYYQVNNEALDLFWRANFPVKYQIRFIAKNLTNYADHKDIILESMICENGKARQASVDVVFKIVESGISYELFATPSTDVKTLKFMTFYCFRLGELYNAGFEDALHEGKLLEIPEDFAEYGAFLLSNSSVTHSVLTYIEVLFCNLSSPALSQFLDRFGYQLYEVSLIPRLRFQIRRVFVAAGLCVGRDYIEELFDNYLTRMIESLEDFAATHYPRRLEQKVHRILRKVSPQSFPGRYEANTYILLNLPVPARLKSQLATTAFKDELINLKAGTTQEQIDEIFEEKSESEENVDEFVEQAIHKEDQNAILENIKNELAQIRARKAFKPNEADFGERYRNTSGGGDVLNKGKPMAKIPLSARVDVRDLRKIKRSDKIGDEKLRRAVEERVLKGRDANTIRSKKVQGGRKRIEAAYRHASELKTKDRKEK